MQTKRRIKKRKDGTKKKRKHIKINSNFESGNIIVKSIEKNNVKLEIRKDPYIKNPDQKKYQYWFYFYASNVLNKKCTFTIQDIVIIPNTWDKYNDWHGLNVAYSYDNKNWKRCKTNFNGKNISWRIKPTKNKIWFAYYPPYTFSRTKKIFKNGKIIGYSHLKNPIYMKKIGDGPVKIGVIARQHPGETIGSWIMEGFVKRALKKKHILGKNYTIYMVGNANPDGTILGHWYTNNNGINLNNDWKNTKSAEIKVIKKFLKKNKFDLFFDLHGDEGSYKHFLVAPGKDKNILHNNINLKLNNKCTQFRPKNYYPEYYSRNHDAHADNYFKGITVEGAMKHKILEQTLQNVPLKIGKHLVDILIELQK